MRVIREISEASKKVIYLATNEYGIVDLVQTYDDNTKIYTIDAEYERFINERIEYAPEVIKAFTDKKDDRFVYAVSIDKSYQKLKNTKELAEEIIEKILEEE